MMFQVYGKHDKFDKQQAENTKYFKTTRIWNSIKVVFENQDSQKK